MGGRRRILPSRATVIELHSFGLAQKEIAKMYHASPQAVSNCIGNHPSWTFIRDNEGYLFKSDDALPPLHIVDYWRSQGKSPEWIAQTCKEFRN